MKLKEKARKVANEVLEGFQSGAVPKALAQVFIRRDYDMPSRAWSWRNRLIAALRGHYDARGFRQWEAVGRHVKKGERAFYILAPMSFKAREDDEERGIKAGEQVLIGFRTAAVFGASQTEGEPLPDDGEQAAFLDALPLIEVARSWGIDVHTFETTLGDRQGYFSPGRIGLGVENLSTWAHELVHAADHRLGTLSRKAGQQLDNETVAEFGGTILLECLGYATESDRGGAYRYIEHYAKQHEREVISVCTEFLDRVCACVGLILETSESLDAAA